MYTYRPLQLKKVNEIISTEITYDSESGFGVEMHAADAERDGSVRWFIWVGGIIKSISRLRSLHGGWCFTTKPSFSRPIDCPRIDSEWLDGWSGLPSVRSPSWPTADAPIADGIVDPPVLPCSSICKLLSPSHALLAGNHLTCPSASAPRLCPCYSPNAPYPSPFQQSKLIYSLPFSSLSSLIPFTCPISLFCLLGGSFGREVFSQARSKDFIYRRKKKKHHI